MELIFRYEKITLLKCECRKRFKLTLIFSSYSRLVVDASIKEAPFSCSTCLVLFHTFFKILIIFFAETLFPVLFKCSLARQDDFKLPLFTNKKFLSWKKLSWGAIVRGQLSGGNYPGSNYLGGNYPRGNYPGAIIRVQMSEG